MDKRYCIVYLEHDGDYFPAICREKYVLNDLIMDYNWSDLPFSELLNDQVEWKGHVFKDLITGKTITSADHNPGKRRGSVLKYHDGYNYNSDNFMQGVKFISKKEALGMLCALTEEQIVDYEIILNDIEQQELQKYKAELEAAKERVSEQKTK